MVKIIRTSSGNQDFIKLIKQLDAFLAITYGELNYFYDKHN